MSTLGPDESSLIEVAAEVGRQIGAGVRLVSFAARPAAPVTSGVGLRAEDDVIDQWALDIRSKTVELTRRVANFAGHSATEDAVIGRGETWSRALEAVDWGSGDPRHEGGPSAFVRRPSPRLAEGLVTHVERSNDVDLTLAQEQWSGYVEALRAAGYTIHEVDPAPDCPDSVFIEDAMVIAGDLMVITAPGASSRAPEVDGARAAALAWGLRVVDLADAPVEGDIALDGGDVLKVGDTAYVGVGGRTTEAGAAAFGHHLASVGYTVVPVQLTKTLHLKSQVTALPDGSVVGYEPLVDDPFFWPSFLAVPEPEGAHVVALGEHTVVMSDAAPRTAQVFRDRGLQVIALQISEFIKLEGCVTCLSVRLHTFD